MHSINAIETHYKGYRFRSRTEARWAVYFDVSNIPWEYEFEGFKLQNGEWYLPDFRLKLAHAIIKPGRPQNRYVWAEVKGQAFTKEEINRCRLLHEMTGQECYMLDGPPSLKSYKSTFRYSDYDPSISPGSDGDSYVDYLIGSYHQYPQTEARFYVSPGEVDKNGNLDEADCPQEMLIAIQAARSARF